MRKLAIFSAAFVLSSAAYVYGVVGHATLWIAAAALLLSVIGRTFYARRISIFCLGIAFALVWCSAYEQINRIDAAAYEESPQTVTVKITGRPYETTYGAAAQCELDGYGAVLYGDEMLFSANAGDFVTCGAEIYVRSEDLNSRADGLVLSLYAVDETVIVKGQPNLLQRVKAWMYLRIDTLFSGEVRGLIKALLLGDRSELSYSVTNALSVAGLSHAVAVSGMHISILIAMVAMLCGYHPRLMALIGIPVVAAFAVLTGASPSVCRAAIMQIMLLLAPIVRRERDGATTLAAAALVLVAENPWCVASISFQLSFAAVGGLLVFSSAMQKKILSLRKKPGKILQVIAAGLSATLSASLTTLPLTVFYFGIISIAAPIINLLVLWAVTAVFVLSLSACCLGPLGAVLAFAASVLGQFILKAAQVVAGFPYAAAYSYHVLLMIWAALFYFFLAAVLLFRKLPVRWLLSGLTGLFCLCVLSGHVRFVSQPWHMTVLDVGQGQCIVLRIEDFTAVIDCGGSSPEAAGEKAVRYLHSAGVTHADALILTHYDSDHAAGAEQFLSRVPTDTVYLPPYREEEEIVASIKDLAPIVEVKDLTEIMLPSGKFTLYPPLGKENDANNGVCILATAQEYDILITGDLDTIAEMRLMSVYELPQVELLVAGHHGAKSSTSYALLEIVSPKVAAISVGTDNRYGHPHEETLNRLQEYSVEIYRTDLMGDLHFYPERR